MTTLDSTNVSRPTYPDLANKTVFITGGSVKGGVYGDHPSLTDLDHNGNLKFVTDFRAVYATVIQRWLGTDPTPILNGTFEPLAFV